PQPPTPPSKVSTPPRVPVEPPAAAAPEAESPADPIIKLPPRPRRSPVLKRVRRGITLGLSVLAVALVVQNWDHFENLVQNARDAIAEQTDVAKPDPSKDRNPPNSDPVKVAGPVFPRRLLAVFPSQYLFANRVNPGAFDRSFGALVQKLTT